MKKNYNHILPVLTLKYTLSVYKKSKITSSLDSFHALKSLFNANTLEYKEEVIVLYLNTANNTIGYSKHTSGGTSSSIIDVKIILSEALLCGAANIILAHNHPSSNLEPSNSDKTITNKLASALKTMDIKLLDHIIIAGDLFSYYSFADQGLL